jgi:hypothetical protein
MNLLINRFPSRIRRSLLLVAGLVVFLLPAFAWADGFDYPLDAAVDDKGAIYLADRKLPGIWKAADGKLEVYFQASKMFRTPLNAVRCVAIDKQGRLLAGDSATREVYRFDEAGKPTPLTDGGIGIPMAIAVDSQGNIFVADLEIHRIWKIPADGGKAEIFATITAPRGLAVDADDRLWVVSNGGKDQVLRIDKEGKIEIVVKDRPFQFPHNIVLDAQQTAYVTDGYAKTVWKIEAGSEPEPWIAGEPLINPVGLAWEGDRLLIVDPHAKAVFRADGEGGLQKLELELKDE